jgi:hypothetical protein
MGRIVDPPEGYAFEIKADSAIYEDGTEGLAWGQFGKELKELVILYPEDDTGFPVTYPDEEIHLRNEDLQLRQYSFRAFAEQNSTLGTTGWNILSYALSAEVEVDILLLEDGTSLSLEDLTYHLLEVQNV